MRSFLVPLLSLIVLLATSAPAAIVFSETLNDNLIHITDVIHSADRGITPGVPFDVEKYVENASTETLWNYMIVLSICEGGLRAGCLPAGPTANMSFLPGDYWLDKNMATIDPSLWTGGLTNTPEQKLLFQLGFPLEPDDVLSIHFKMVDNNPTGSYWSLVQIANTPEPGTFLFVSIGFLLCLARKLQHN